MSQAQPVFVYPNTVTKQPSNHSNGSFETVFIILAVIVVISGFACCLGRLCNRRHHHQKPKPSHPSHAVRPREGDIEFGFDKGIPTARHPRNGEMNGFKPRLAENGEIKGEMKPADHDGHFRPSA
ncbi:hypothetical protein RJ641_002843 [Dillenia turbinata]|uniref:Uncharacterized protein n=1 Tax=Dillenia turbinata TaxID=194707 RepID=A0AAN8ZDP2_9MAGN